ncbi:MAG TPA: GAF domain-containing protein, partial [Polyangiaceae bacterium]|nr:GAF domain-containing protein [Polyangiaceae bacterium]
MSVAPGSSRESLRRLSKQTEAGLVELERVARVIEANVLRYGDILTRPHPLILCVRRGNLACLVTSAKVWDRARDLLAPFTSSLAHQEARVLLLGTPLDPDLSRALDQGVAALLGESPSVSELCVALHNAFELMELKTRSESRGKWLSRYRFELGELIEIARALTTEREIDKLLSLILEKARFVTGADAGSLYVVEGDEPDILRRKLHFKLSQNDSLSFDSREFVMPINARSMAGYVALEKTTLSIADVYDMPASSPFGFDRSFDERVGYRSKSMLVTPLTSSLGEVFGVFQLFIKMREPSKMLLSPAEVETEVVAF